MKDNSMVKAPLIIKFKNTRKEGAEEMSWFAILKSGDATTEEVEDWDSQGKPTKDDDMIECPTCRGQGFRDAYSGDPDHDGETCYHCYGHKEILRTEKDNIPIDDLMRNLAANPTRKNKQAVHDFFNRQRRMEEE
jgi:hypothetical protein